MEMHYFMLLRIYLAILRKFVSKLLGIVYSKTCDKIFSTDMYYPDSVQSMERHRRGSGDKLIIKGANIKKPKCWKKIYQIIKININ